MILITAALIVPHMIKLVFCLKYSDGTITLYINNTKASKYEASHKIRFLRVVVDYNVDRMQVYSCLLYTSSYRLNTCKSRGSMNLAC